MTSQLSKPETALDLHGKCIGGPYDGKEYAHYAKTFSVVYIDGNPLRELVFQREGHYMFFDGIWRWLGPSSSATESDGK